ncbi:putative uncharacterized protein DDB_G0282133 [Lucilia cuprina]|uniref:putative uncharacterized protein DDB_G0282133 n=1 Tax=Lucilia cuprina TaxID=7375 RepID=UPI001F06C633|nr:putative uncharacterized protein DDB_G0282133 [Lucilia cuprina]
MEKNAYFVMSSPYNNNNYDPKNHTNYLSVKTPTNERSSLSSAPKQNNCVDNSAKEKINKQTTNSKTTTNERSPLSSAPNKKIVWKITQKKIEKQTTDTMVDDNSNANVNNITNSINNNIKTIKTINDKEDHSSPMSKNTGAIPKNKPNTLSSHKTEKIQTGMDRYVTYTKRKSSPRTSKLEPNPNPKIRYINKS